MANSKIYNETFAKQMDFLDSLEPDDVELIRFLVLNSSKQSSVYIFPNNENKHEVNIRAYEYIDIQLFQGFEITNHISSNFLCVNTELLEAA